MAILSTQVLMDFYHTGFVRPERNAEFAKRAPERIIPLGGVDPRAPNAVEEVERQVTELGMKGFKWYTAEWRGESRGWNANDPAVFPCYEKALELGVKNHFFHKGPAVEPLSLSKFDVRDIDEPAWLYPEMNFIIDHCGAPRVEDFCWLATRCPNVYAGLAVVLALIHNRPRWFAEVMANLLYWLGPDRIIYGTDFPIWYPHWQLDDFMAFELPEDLKEEYGVDLTPEIKQQIIGGNIARLYGIDVPAKLEAIKDDELSRRRGEYLGGEPAVVPTDVPGTEQPAVDTGVAGTVKDPEVRTSIADLGLLDEVEVDGGRVTVRFHLTSPLCPAKFAGAIGQEIRRKVAKVPGVESVEVVLTDHFMAETLHRLINEGDRFADTRGVMRR
jgi:predicted TIM-barrel fold metal-dependent hydrolase/metal-sulfur cluster biosynthetic enzyme